MRSPPAAYSITKQTCEDVWKQANMLTRKGCRIELATSKIRFSASSDSTSSLEMMSPFFSALMAKYSPVFW